MIGIVLDLVVPDVPQSVEDEIRREKLLAARLAAKAKKANALERTGTISEPAAVPVSIEEP